MDSKPKSPKRVPAGISRRQVVAASSMLPLAGALAQAQPPQAAQGGRGRGGGRGAPQGGRGPIKVLLVTKFHPFDRGNFFDFFDSLGETITWTHVENPAASEFFSPKLADPYDVLVFYDMAGRDRRKNSEGNYENVFVTPSPEIQQNLKTLLRNGDKGFVFLHHALASWVHTWPQYVEVVGAAADWGSPITVRGKDYPKSGYRQHVKEHITVVDKSHPVVAGLGDGYDIEDEVYLCPMFEDSVHCLLRTDFKPIDSNFPMQSAQGWHHPPGSNMAGWVKTAESTPVVYLQNGHDNVAWTNPAYKTLVTNAIKWVNTSEAKSWAKANPSKIFA
ncbi:MAG TPA: ThuA domain-containing protein [Bryobacteraceae bacterium]|nr:ThuA domain-containing protein [Bryobacteraceae bacterium]